MALPQYQMATLLLPKTWCEQMDMIFKSFWWGFHTQSSRHFTPIAWNKICLPKEWGGVGLRRLFDINQALIAKLGWHLLQQPSKLWAQGLCHIREFLMMGACCVPQDGNSIDIFHDPWVLGFGDGRPIWRADRRVADGLRVADLFDFSLHSWKRDVIGSLFEETSQMLFGRLGDILGFNDAGLDRCPLCRLDREDGEHLFIKCPVARDTLLICLRCIPRYHHIAQVAEGLFPGQYRCNVDVAIRDTMAILAVSFLDSEGSLCLVYTEQIPSTNSLIGESSALAAAVNLALDRNWNVVNFETDCQFLSSLIHDHSLALGPLLEDILVPVRAFFSSHLDCSLCWIPRERNQFAHLLAKWSAERSCFGIISISAIPAHLFVHALCLEESGLCLHHVA
ncbi:hypothetical protein CJ030_MR1G005226 [Morella rubra]|uniref:RNase H type-1 domain-containing protein n=1 Tax=Morella rubra TaxID=262757 RepID=A0A6A1WKM0_9ROSI|nr:hypothetical protein CJ030_MR1G005226 [Morella rubra]